MDQADTVGHMAEAASNFLAGLDATGQQKALIDFADTVERENWHYIPRDRAGLPLKEMDEKQQQLAHALVATGVSAQGYEKLSTIMSLEPILAELEGGGRRFPRDPELYYVSVFGEPGTDAPWGWRFEGHHISLNYTLVKGRMLGPTPLFFGSNPGEVRHGEQTGLRALKEEEDLGRQLLHALDGEQKTVAIVDEQAPDDIITTNVPYVRGEVQPEGLGSQEMNAAQREILYALVETYVKRLPEAVAEAEWARLVGADLQAAHFAWAGAEERGGPHYYRVLGPSFLAEYDNTQNDANHIHAVWRDLSNDFGEDILRRHYKEGHA
ncbi:MAG: DUF3500 domain-containing protein [Gemmatimonadetes bacterium]|jgi:hypothetical protein|nr:DUF3500 domain-containing protein [Gemmatimonadota bacterium]MBT5449766.1 DUF3500 domain-containing protein [Gemmatimonadota bacterium]MBT5801352.1 DUF3500 domain-containing protein [Gemmatimonadota bacterium]MBT6622715.1 DUF3500 domain-containing protein [Gemmatimonadota bacterium]MBT6907162.1 DUF3500 domain-containing protein [Gemmatimonadota bacterium]